MEVLYLAGAPGLHIVDAETRYGAAIFVKTKMKNPTVAEVWEAFGKAWALTSTGMPDTIQTDKGSQFTAQEFNLLLSAHGIEHTMTGVESHHSNGSIENAYHPLRTIFLKLKSDYPNLSDDLILGMDRKATNDVSGPKEMPPTMLVYGFMPRARASGLDFALQKMISGSRQWSQLDRNTSK